MSAALEDCKDCFMVLVSYSAYTTVTPFNLKGQPTFFFFFLVDEKENIN